MAAFDGALPQRRRAARLALAAPRARGRQSRGGWTVLASEAAARTIVEVFATGDLDLVSALISPAYVDHQGLGGRELRGPAGFRQVVEAARGWFSGLAVTVEDLVAEPDRAAMRLRWRGTTPSGEAVTRETLELLRFEDGLAVEHWGAEVRHSEPAADGGE